MKPPLRFHVKVFYGLAGLDQLAPEWDQLVSRMASPRHFHTVAWHRAFLETLEPSPEMTSLAALYDGNEIHMILPLRAVPRRMFGMNSRILQLWSHPESPFGDLVAVDGDQATDLLGSLLVGLSDQQGLLWDAIRFPRILDASLAAQAIRGAGFSTVQNAALKCDYLTVQPYQLMLDGFSRNFRSNLRKARNKLAALSNVEFQSINTLPELLDAYRQFVSVEASGWKGSAGRGTALSNEPRLKSFYEQLLVRFGGTKNGECRGDGCEINLLKHEGRTIAGQFALLWNDTYHLLKIGYDQDFAHESPGNMLLEHLCKRLEHDRHVQRIHLLSDADWHTDWNAQHEVVSTVHLFNSTFGGRRTRLAMWMMRRSGR